MGLAQFVDFAHCRSTGIFMLSLHLRCPRASCLCVDDVLVVRADGGVLVLGVWGLGFQRDTAHCAESIFAAQVVVARILDDDGTGFDACAGHCHERFVRGGRIQVFHGSRHGQLQAEEA